MNKLFSFMLIMSVFLGCKNKTTPIKEDQIILETSLKSNNYFDDVEIRKTFDFNNKDSDGFLHNNATYVNDILDNKKGAILFNSKNKSFSSINGFKLSNKFTLAIWFKPKEIEGNGFSPISNRSINGVVVAPTYQFLFGARGKDYNASPYSFIFWASINGKLKQLSSLINWKPETWYHLAATFDGEIIKLYVNGKLQSQKFAKGLIENSDEAVFFGKHFKYNSYTDGSVDDFQYYSRVLAIEEILSLTE